MAAYDLEEQEQLAEIKAWWKQYGNLLMNVLTAAALTVLAWQGWNWYQRNQSAQASQVYHVLSVAVQDNDSQRIKAASGELLEKFSSSTYASLGALSASKAMVDAGDAKTARVQLQWVVDKGKDELRELARLRLTEVLIDEEAYDEALQRLSVAAQPAFAARALELKGDVLSTQGKSDEARRAYHAALDAGGKVMEGPVREILQQKLDALGGAVAGAAA